MNRLQKQHILLPVLALGLDGELTGKTLKRWNDTGLFQNCPFEADNRYISQGFRMVGRWLSDLYLYPELGERRKQDYLELFVGTPTPRAPLCASFYLEEEKLVLQKTSSRLSEWYGKYGLRILEEKGLPEDDLRFELVFFRHLIEQMEREKREGAKEEAGAVLQDIRTFAREEMLSWIPAWREDVQMYAMTDYYRGLANLVYGSMLLFQEAGNEADDH